MNNRVLDVEISGIRKFFNMVPSAKGALSLTLGQPDFKTPKSIKDGMIRAINEDKTTYTSNNGIVELREKIASYLGGFGINYKSSDICLTVGGSEGLYVLLTALVNEGESVLIPSPAYPAYESIVKIIGGNIVNYGLNEDFTINIEEIRKGIILSGAKVLILSFPSNPTGAILGKEERDDLVKLIKEENIIVVTDEMYSSIIFDDYYSVAQCEEIKDNIVFVGGFSKMFSSTGLRLGYFACNEKIMSEAMKVHQYGVSCATSIVQWGMYYGFDEALEDLVTMKDVFKKRKEYVLKRLREMGLETAEAKGAFYLFPSIEKFNMSSMEFCTKLLYEGGVACVPGSAFGNLGEGYMRISYCYSDEELCESLNRLEKFINKLI